ncbi:MAG: efflux RND transporter periplasmic adaptor subunit [Treponema sp.]|nr:efflux RND transporter periplasmic adaptor subunit [Treponema sp.]
MNKKLLAVILVAVVICVGAALGILWWVVKTGPVVPKSNASGPGGKAAVYIYNGNISSNNLQSCVSPMPLVLKKVYVKEGDYVKKGDRLFLLDDSDVAAAVSQAQAGVQLAKAAFDETKVNLERVAKLQKIEGISQSDFEKAQIAVVTAEAQYNQAKANLDAANYAETKRLVTANFDGMVADIWGHENNMMAAGQKIMDIVDYDNLILEITVDQFEIPLFNIGDAVPVYINAMNLTVNGTVSKISNQAIKTGEVSSFIVTIDLKKNPALRVGLLAEVKKDV